LARPNKEGLDYFPLDTNIDQDDRIALIEAKYNITGFGIIIKLFKKIYANKGYYYEWNEQTQLLFSKQVGLDFKEVNEIVIDALKWNLFNNKLFKKYGILTSKRIQMTYVEATKRRREIPMLKKYLINGVNGYINKINANIILINDDKSTQTETETESKQKQKVNYADTVIMFETEHKKLIEKYGEETTKKMITVLDNYKGSKGKTYKSDYKAILSWVVDKVLGDNKKKENWRTT